MTSDDDLSYDEYITESNGSIEGFLSPWGRFMEDLVEPAIVKLFEARGRECNQFASGSRSYLHDPPIQISLLVSDDEEVIVVDCKSRLSHQHIDEFVSKLEQFRSLFPSYKRLRVYGAVTGIHINTGAANYAAQKGLFVLQPSGDTMEILDFPNFKLREW